MPKSNIDFWKTKLEGNAERDKKVAMQLSEIGWTRVDIWECEVKKNVQQSICRLKKMLSN